MIGTKFANLSGPNGQQVGLVSRPEHIKQAAEGSLKRLNVDAIDLFYQHRVNPDMPIEELWTAVTGWTAWARRMVPAAASDIPKCFTFPSWIMVLNLTLPAPLTGTGLLSGTNLSAATSLGCGAASLVSTSTGTLTIANIPVSIASTPNTSVNVTAPATGSAVIASVTFNVQNSQPGTVKGTSIVVDFPATGPLSLVFHGQVTISHAESTLVCPPIISSVTPNAGPIAGGTTVSIAGTGYNNTSGVIFGGTPATFTVNNDDRITAVAPPGAAGMVDIAITGPAGSTTLARADVYTYVPVPSITSVSPSSGPSNGGGRRRSAAPGFREQPESASGVLLPRALW